MRNFYFSKGNNRLTKYNPDLNYSAGELIEMSGFKNILKGRKLTIKSTKKDKK